MRVFRAQAGVADEVQCAGGEGDCVEVAVVAYAVKVAVVVKGERQEQDAVAVDFSNLRGRACERVDGAYAHSEVIAFGAEEFPVKGGILVVVGQRVGILCVDIGGVRRAE